MNYSVIRRILGKILILIGMLMIFPLAISIIYKEPIRNKLAFLIPIICLFILGNILGIKADKNNNKMNVREGIVIVGLTWLLMALFGCIPFLISKEIPNFFNAFFEMSSGLYAESIPSV